MSEKITFRDLIDSIAEETDRSKEFTHDFLKDFADVINDGLESDGNVNIAGFGKFDLKRVDEREGYNPQTEEKMIIPAHNKIVFKPYKDVRELVNAPYTHLEPELLDEQDKKEQTSEAPSSDSSPTEDEQNDFIPTAPPTSHHHAGNKTSDPERPDEDEFIPLDLEDEISVSSSFSLEEDDAEENNDDIVEFDRQQESEDEIDDALDAFFDFSESTSDSNEQNKETTEDEPDQVDQQTEVTEHSEDESEELTNQQSAVWGEDNTTSDDTKEVPPSSTQEDQRYEERSSLPVLFAAACILLLLAGGAWYYNMVSEDSSSPKMAANQPVPSVQEDQQKKQQQSKNAAGQQNQPASTNNAATVGASNSSKPIAEEENENLSIKEGQTLWSIAEEKYGNPRLWPWIYGTNERLKDPDLILAGNSLSVPVPTGPRNSLAASDSIGVSKGYISTYQWYKENDSSKAKDHLWAAKLYHEDIRAIADIKIDQADLSYANKAR